MTDQTKSPRSTAYEQVDVTADLHADFKRAAGPKAMRQKLEELTEDYLVQVGMIPKPEALSNEE